MSASILYLGLDVHKESVTIAVLPADAATPREVIRVPFEWAKLRRYFARLSADGAVLRACYEASGAGYVLQRAMTEWGHQCTIVASSLIPTKPGERRKHDKHDAIQLARLYRAGELTAIRIPSLAEEQVREIVRCRETLQREILRSRHYLLKLLLRRGLVYHDGAHWTARHRAWLATLRQDQLTGGDAVAFDEYLALLDYKLDRRAALDRQIEALALTPAYQPTVARLCCFRGVNTLGAMVLATELGDWQRFAKPTQLMAYLGLVPSEASSGTRERRGGITKAGNSRCRHILVQAAWTARRVPARGGRLRRAQQGQPPDVVAHAWKAQQRLHTLFHRIAHRRPAQVAAVAVARELVGFLWATMRTVAPVGASA
jgi:transposase